MNISKKIANFANEQISNAKDQTLDPFIAFGLIVGYLRGLSDSCQITPIEYHAYLYTYSLDLAKLANQETKKDAEALQTLENLKATANRLLNEMGGITNVLDEI